MEPLKLQALAASLCGQRSFQALVDRLNGASQGGGTCTSVWVSGAIAYRCRTCQMTASSAVCVACFQASNHQGHDFVLYRSPSGGCCDCGDLGSWALEGCCPRHRPGSAQDVSLSQVLGEAQARALVDVAAAMVLELAHCVNGAAGVAGRGGAVNRSADAQLAVQYCQTLSKLVATPALRSAVCELAAQPLEEVASGQEQRAEEFERGSGAAAAGGGNSTWSAADTRQLSALHRSAAESARALREAMGLVPPHRAACVVRQLVACMDRLPEAALSELTTLITLLLYDTGFKYSAVHMMDYYSTLLRGVVVHGLGDAGGPGQVPGGASTSGARALGTALDRLTVQFLNSEEVMCRLIKEERMFHVVFEAAGFIIARVVEVIALSRQRDQETSQKALQALQAGYRRVLGDLHAMSHYPSVAHAFLTDKAVLTDGLLQCLSKLQCMVPQVCIQPGHPAAQEAQAVVPAACNFELVTAYSISELVSTCLGCKTTQQPVATPPPGQMEMLEAASKECLLYLVSWSTSHHWLVHRSFGIRDPGPDPGLDVRFLYHRIATGQQPVSPHLLLHRITGNFIQALLSVELGSSPGDSAAASAVLASLLRDLAAPCQPHQAATPTSTSASVTAATAPDHQVNAQAVLRHIFMLQAWLSQIGQRVWVRNGDDTMHVEMAYQLWRDTLQDLDLVLTMLGFAAGRQAAVLLDMLQTLGALPLLQAAGVVPRTLPRVAGPAPPEGWVTQSGELRQLAAAEDALRQLVSLLRNRVVCGTPARFRLKQVLLHSLAMADAGYAQLTDTLSLDLQHRSADIDEVLAELSVYRPPSLSSAAAYSLRKEAWEQFDPHFHHLGKRTLHRALERAAAAGLYKPHWQLRPPSQPLPPSLRGMLDVLIQPQLTQLVAFIIQSMAAQHTGKHASHPRLSDDLLLSAFNLLALQLSYLEDLVQCASSTDGQAASTSPAAAAGPAAQEGHAARAQQAVAAIMPMLLGKQERGQPGVLQHLSALVEAGRPAPASTRGAGSAGGAASGPAVGADVLDCCQHLVQRAQQVVGLVRTAGLLPDVPGGAAAGGTDAVTGADAAGQPGGSGGDSAAGAETRESQQQEDAKALARQRQKALMERMRAQQAAFAQSHLDASGGGDVARSPGLATVLGGSSEEEEDEDEEEDERRGEQEQQQEQGAEGETERDQEGDLSSTDSQEEGDQGAGEAAGPIARSLGAGHPLEATPSRRRAHQRGAGAQPLMGTWGRARGECVLCQSSSSRHGQLGPLGWVGHMGICACLSVPAPQAPDNAPSLQDGTSPPSRQAIASPAAGSAGAATQSAPARPQQQQQLQQQRSGVAPGSVSVRELLRAGGGSVALGDAWLKQQLRTHGPLASLVDQQPGLHVHSCGHMMHLACFQSHRATLQETAASDPLFPGYHLLSTSRREFLCPKCRRLSNCLMPAAPFTWRHASSTPAATSASAASPRGAPSGRGVGSRADVDVHAAQRHVSRLAMYSEEEPHTELGPTSMSVDVGPGHELAGASSVSSVGGGVRAGVEVLLRGLPLGTQPASSSAMQPPQQGGDGHSALQDAARASAAQPPLSSEADPGSGMVAAQEQPQSIPAARTWPDLAQRLCGPVMAPMILDLSKQVYVEVSRHSSSTERGVESRALLTAHLVTVAEAAVSAAAAVTAELGAVTRTGTAAAQGAGGAGALATPPPPQQQQQQQQQGAQAAHGSLDLTVPDSSGEDDAEEGEEGGDQPWNGTAAGVSRQASGANTSLHLTNSTGAPLPGSSPTSPAGSTASRTAHVWLEPPLAITPFLEPWAVAAAAATPAEAANGTAPAGSTQSHAAAAASTLQAGAVQSPRQRASPRSPADVRQAAASAAQPPSAHPLVLPSGGVSGLIAPTGSFARPATTTASEAAAAAAWRPALYSESVGEVRRRCQHEPLVPALWATLAHNLAHWEALRRPTALINLGARAGASYLPAPPTAPSSGGGGAAQASAAGPPAPLMRQGVVEVAHMTGLQSLLLSCLSLGSGQTSAHAAAMHLQQLLAWLVGPTDGTTTSTAPAVPQPEAQAGAGPVGALLPPLASTSSVQSEAAMSVAASAPSLAAAAAASTAPPPPRAPMCTSAGLVCSYEPGIATSVLRAFLANRYTPTMVSGMVPVRVLCSRQVADAQQLLGDPLLLALELLALALSAHSTGDGASSTPIPMEAAAAGGVVSQEAATTPQTLLTAVLQVVLPIATLQSVAWLAMSGSGDRRELGGGGSGSVPWWEELWTLLQAISSPSTSAPGAAGAEAAVAAHLLPLLTRLHLLHTLLGGASQPSPPSSSAAPASHLHGAAQHQLDQLQAISTRYSALPAGGSSTPAGRAQCLELADTLCEALGVRSVRDLLAQGTAHLANLSTTGSGGHVGAGGGVLDGQAGCLLGAEAAALMVRWTGHLAWAFSLWRRGAGARLLGGASSSGAGQMEGLHAAVGGPGRAWPDVASLLGLCKVLPPPPSLIPLPATFQELLLHLTDKPCSMCGKVSEQPSLCLVTGKLLCHWWRGCTNNRGGGLLHALESCGGCTLVLSLRSTKVMVLRTNRLTVCPSPYLDSHGEEDVDLKRGRPLFLNTQMYAQLAGLWASSATEFDSRMLQSSRVDLVFL